MIKINHNAEIRAYQRRLENLRLNLTKDNVRTTNEVIISLIAIMEDYLTFEEKSPRCSCPISQPLI